MRDICQLVLLLSVLGVGLVDDVGRMRQGEEHGHFILRRVYFGNLTLEVRIFPIFHGVFQEDGGIYPASTQGKPGHPSRGVCPRRRHPGESTTFPCRVTLTSTSAKPAANRMAFISRCFVSQCRFRLTTAGA